MPKPESVFTSAVHRLLPKEVYREKMANPYRGGTPDMWYSGDGSDLWVEYKYLPRIRKRGVVDAKKLLTALQAQWLRDRFTEGRHVAVIVGCPVGGVILPRLSWDEPLTVSLFLNLIRSRPDVAQWIATATLGRSNVGTPPSSRSTTAVRNTQNSFRSNSPGATDARPAKTRAERDAP